MSTYCERWAYSEPCHSALEKTVIAFKYFRKTLRLKSLRGF